MTLVAEVDQRHGSVSLGPRVLQWFSTLALRKTWSGAQRNVAMHESSSRSSTHPHGWPRTQGPPSALRVPGAASSGPCSSAEPVSCDAVRSPPNVRSGRYFIVESKIRCSQCQAVSAVLAFSVPAGYESRYVGDDTADDESGTWESQEIAAVLSYVEYLPDTVATRVRAPTPHYRLKRDGETGRGFWMSLTT
jgi:hypothetical protein